MGDLKALRATFEAAAPTRHGTMRVWTQLAGESQQKCMDAFPALLDRVESAEAALGPFTAIGAGMARGNPLQYCKTSDCDKVRAHFAKHGGTDND